MTLRLFEKMSNIVEQEKQKSQKFSDVCALPSFGNVAVAQPLEAGGLALLDAYPRNTKVERMLDEQVYPRLLHLRACALHVEFTNRMRQLFPESDGRYHLVVGPVKEVDRIASKISQEDGSVPFPRARTSKDALRNTVECADGDALVEAYDRIVEEFGLANGRGRLKNKLGGNARKPPSMLLNATRRAIAQRIRASRCSGS